MGSLIVKSILGLLFLVFVLALALFLSAGTLGFLQAWIYLVVFFVCVLLITIYLMINDPALLSRRIQAGPIAETRKLRQVIQSLASVFFIALFIVPGLDYRFGWSNVPRLV